MNKVEGLHHLAITTANMKEQIEFFTDNSKGIIEIAVSFLELIPTCKSFNFDFLKYRTISPSDNPNQQKKAN